MLTSLFDRIISPLVLYLSLTFCIYALRNTLPNLCVAALFCLDTFWVGKIIIYALVCEVKLDRLGQRASQYRKWSWTPFNLGMMCEAAMYSVQQRADQWWWGLFSQQRKSRPFTCETILAGERIIYTIDEDNIKAILATQFGAYGKGSQFRKEWKDFLGLSIFTTDGTLWHDSRHLLRPHFTRKHVSDLEPLEKHIKTLLPLLAGSSPGATVPADVLFYRFTLDVITGFLFGDSINSLHTTLDKFARAFDEVQRAQSIIASIGRMAFFMPKKRFFESLSQMDSFIEPYIDCALELTPNALQDNTEGDESSTFLDAIASFTRDRQVLRDQILAVLLAGRDTTACMLSWLIYELSREPTIVQKLRREIVSQVGVASVPTYEDLKNMRYLQHTLNEALRLYPAVPYNVRVALEDTTLPRGGGPDGLDPVSVLKDTHVRYSTLIMQRRSEIYPPESEIFPHYLKFAPERWDQWTPKAWTYIPFNGGPRTCIGQQFALTEIAYTVVRILQTFDKIECRMETTPKLDANIVLQPLTSVDIAFSATDTM